MTTGYGPSARTEEWLGVVSSYQRRSASWTEGRMHIRKVGTTMAAEARIALPAREGAQDAAP